MHDRIHSALTDVDPTETEEWLDSLEDLVVRWGPDRVGFLLGELRDRARSRGVELPFDVLAPCVNTIAEAAQPEYPGDEALEERIEAVLRWNAMAMVTKANKERAGIGGHIATYASSATFMEVGFNHVFRGAEGEGSGDHLYIQGHGSPGIYARGHLEGRLTLEQIHRFRGEVGGGGLPSYPHPWLMPDFWQFPTVSMGLGPLTAIYQGRFNRYLHNRGLVDTSTSQVWAFLGDGEMDEPESRGAIHIAARDRLDNVCFVINCNLQRLDGPVRGNANIVPELEGCFRGAGWNVIKVLWSSAWDELFRNDEHGLIEKRLASLVDGKLQRIAALGAAELRRLVFDTPELAALIEGWDDEKLASLHRGGFDRRKVYAAYQAARDHTGAPSLILMHTVKGWGMGKVGQGAMSTHGQKKIKDKGLLEFRDRYQIPLDDAAAQVPELVTLAPDSPEIQYVMERRKALGGPLPARSEGAPALSAPSAELFEEFMAGSGGREVSTTMAFVRTLNTLMRSETHGKLCVPVIPDEARTFGMESFFRSYGIFDVHGQLYEPVDRKALTFYKESLDGQVLEEGISEAGGMASFIAAGTAYATHGINTIPFYIFYSMFGFQRIADMIWSACDSRARGFLLGATAGRTTLNGEGLQHQDGHGLLMASPFPTLRAYEPAFAYETAILIREGLERMYERQEPAIYYITLHNENYEMPALPPGPDRERVVTGVVDGMYLFRKSEAAGPRVQLFGSGSILRQVLQAATTLEEQYGVAADVWSVTSYKQLRGDATQAERWNRLHADQTPRGCPLWSNLEGVEGPFVATSDNVSLVPDQISPWVPGRLWVLGTDGFGRSDTRENLRRHFEIDAAAVTVAALGALAERGALEPDVVVKAMADLGVDPDQPDSLFA
ncbi:MAG: pyruvate dehydrogenase (acetyl-transferring), homodimeric type [Planctomycetes bacterium]|nr:pyruvate dehydrogenase (acetyl-transferring), homodimeric type [Planctomycetota bacterium]